MTNYHNQNNPLDSMNPRSRFKGKKADTKNRIAYGIKAYHDRPYYQADYIF